MTFTTEEVICRWKNLTRKDFWLSFSNEKVTKKIKKNIKIFMNNLKNNLTNMYTKF